MTNAEIESALNWRYATKRYDASKKVSAADWKTLTAALINSPSSFGLQPWKFVVVENPALREQLKAASYNQTQITDASHLVVFTTRDRITEADVGAFIARTAEVRGVTIESLKSYQDMLTNTVVRGFTPERAAAWAQRQSYIAIGFLVETASLLKVDATPMEGIDPAGYDKILGLEGKGWKTVAVVALGYRHPEDSYQHAAKVRYTPEQLIDYRK